jgi:predicted permease
MYYQVLSISAPVFILVAIGFFISKINIDLNQKTIGFLLTHVGSPCLIFHTLSTTKPNINILMEIGFAAVLVTVFNFFCSFTIYY